MQPGLGRNPIESWIGQFESFAIGHELIRSPKLRFAELWKDWPIPPRQWRGGKTWQACRRCCSAPISCARIAC
jgi:hypothetical protein